MRFWSLVLCAACASSSPPPPVATPPPSGAPVPQDPLWDTVQARVGTEQMWTEISARGSNGEKVCELLVKVTLERRPSDKILSACHRGGGGRAFNSTHDRPARQHAEWKILLENEHPVVALPAEAKGADVGYADYTVERDRDTCHAHRTPGLVCLQTDADEEMYMEIEADPEVLVPGPAPRPAPAPAVMH